MYEEHVMQNAKRRQAIPDNNRIDQTTTAAMTILPNSSDGKACGHHTVDRVFARLAAADVACL